YYRLSPLKRCGSLIVDGHKIVYGLPQLLRRGETCAAQCLATQNAEPALHLIEPGRVCGGEVQVHVLVPLQPPVLFGLVRVQIVENHMDLPISMLGHDPVHKIQELPPSATVIMCGSYQSGRDLKSCK